MKRYRTLKFLNRYFTPRDWRCHKRRVFFEAIFEQLKEIRNYAGDHVKGYVQYNESSFRLACHEMAAEIPFYPFEERCSIDVGEFFVMQVNQPFYSKLKVTIKRISPLYKLIFGFGKYEVHVYGDDEKRNPIDFKYTEKIKIF